MSISRVLRLLGLLVLSAFLALPVHAQEDKNLVWERYDVTFDVQRDGRMLVTETQQIRFLSGEWENGGRKVPLGRVDDISQVEVAEVGPGGSLEPLPARTATEGNELQIAWQFPPTFGGEVRTFQVRYLVEGVVGVYPESHQVRWIAVPEERRFPVEAGRVTLNLPGSVPPEDLQLESYPERLRGEEQPTENGALFTIDGIPSYEGFEVRAEFPLGVVQTAAPRWQQAADRQAYLNENVKPRNNVTLLGLGVLIPVVGLVGLLVLWLTRGKDPGVGRDVEQIKTPPSDLPAPLAGVLLDEEANVQDVISTIVSLAERGVLRITQETNEKLMGSSSDFRLELLQPYRPENLRTYERLLVENLFGSENSVLLSEAKGRFMAAVPAFKDHLYEEVVRTGLFKDNPDKVRRRYRSLGTGILVLGILLGCVGSSALSQYASAFFVFLPALGLAAVGFGLRRLSQAMPVRTVNGAVEASRWRSFRNYLAHIERTPDIAQDKGAFERYLSYATAFGLGRSWLDKFSSVGTPAPAWYTAAGLPDMGLFGGPTSGRHHRRHGGGFFGGGPVIIVPPFGGGYSSGGGSAEGGGATGGDLGGLFGNSGLFDFGDGRGTLDRTSGGFGDLLDQASDAFGGGGWGGGGAGGFGGGSGGGGADFS